MTASTLLPKELWDVIFAHACTDDGATGRALSLVSRHIRTVSADHQHRSVALYGNTKITAFAALLLDESCRPELCQVHNLLVEIDPFTAKEKSDFQKPPPSRPAYDPVRQWQIGNKDEEDDLKLTEADMLDMAATDMALSSVADILRLTAPTLARLTLIANRLAGERWGGIRFRSRAKVGLRSLLSIPLPLLTEMSSMGINCTRNFRYKIVDSNSSSNEGSDNDDPADEGDNLGQYAAFTSLESVRRLHIDSPESAMALGRSLPRLSHLRVSDPLAVFEGDRRSNAFMRALRTLQDIRKGESANIPTSWISDARILDHLEAIIVQTSKGLLPPPYLWRGRTVGSPPNYWRSKYRELEEILSECKKDIPNLMVLEKGNSDFDLRDLLVDQWLDRNTGGQGCWNAMEDPGPWSERENVGDSSEKAGEESTEGPNSGEE